MKGMGSKDANARGSTRLTNNLVDIPNKGRRLSMDARIENFHVGSSTVATNKIRMRERQILGKSHKEIEEIWLEVLERIQVTSLKEFMFKEDKLISVSFREEELGDKFVLYLIALAIASCKGPENSDMLMFSSQLTKSIAEKFRGHILQAFEFVLGSSIIIEITCEHGNHGYP
ncbi:hypothetical protein JHK87_052432 [Glycine soja]|nr:hypothetical protein JHK87_052432 [Glycine soja]